MITAEKAIQNLQEVKDFCDNQLSCHSCPFSVYYNGWLCSILMNMTDYDDELLPPSSWETEEIEYEQKR